MVFQHIKSKKCVINGAKAFAEYATKTINGISCLYLVEKQIMAQTHDIQTSPKIPRTLKFHKVLRTYKEDNICKMELYDLAVRLTFNGTHSVRFTFKEGDLEVCGHNQLPLNYEIDQTCGYCKERQKGNEEWLRCKLCDQLFHEACFEK